MRIEAEAISNYTIDWLTDNWDEDFFYFYTIGILILLIYHQ
jgi:hypothetical protein